MRKIRPLRSPRNVYQKNGFYIENVDFILYVTDFIPQTTDFTQMIYAKPRTSSWKQRTICARNVDTTWSKNRHKVDTKWTNKWLRNSSRKCSGISTQISAGKRRENGVKTHRAADCGWLARFKIGVRGQHAHQMRLPRPPAERKK